MNLNIVADENIPHLHALFSIFGEIRALPGRQITASDVTGADVLLVRSVTPVNKALLQSSAVKFVGTCTIGIDHLDTDFLAEQDVTWASAPGCNANAVVQYVVAVLAQLERLTLGGKAVVVGGGNVGSRVYRALKILGFDCRVVDPFLDESSALPLTGFSAIYDADVICVHTPFTTDGAHPTQHMFDEQVLQALKKDTLLINAGRGGVVDNHALSSVLSQRDDLHAVLDVWENEPGINRPLLQQVRLGSPHIAGYSLEGRLHGALMIFDALKAYTLAQSSNDLALLTRAEITKQAVIEKALGEPERITVGAIDEAILRAYSPSQDFKNLLAVADALPTSFDELRKNYSQRREFSHFRCKPVSNNIDTFLKVLGFLIE